MKNIIMEGVDNMGIEEEVISKLEDHEKRICSNSEKIEKHEQKINHHEDEITALQIRGATNEQRFNNLDDKIDSINISLVRMENSQLQSTNLLVNTISNIATANSKNSNDIEKNISKGSVEITKIRLNNNAKFVLKTLAIISGVISILLTGYFGAKYGITVQGIK